MKTIRITDRAYGRLKYIMDVIGASDYSEAINKLIDNYIRNNKVG